jgi:ketosteroid isomerase-like protein
LGNLLDDIEMFIKVRGMTATEFGKRAFNNSAFVFRLRDGKSWLATTEARARRFMMDYAG